MNSERFLKTYIYSAQSFYFERSTPHQKIKKGVADTEIFENFTLWPLRLYLFIPSSLQSFILSVLGRVDGGELSVF